MKKIALVLFSLSFAISLFAQQGTDIGILTSQFKVAKTNKDRFAFALKICNYYRVRGINDSFKIFSQQVLDIAQAEKNDSLLVLAYNNIGVYFTNTSDYSSSLQYHFKALNLAEQNHQSYHIGLLHVNIGWVYDLIGNYPEAIAYCKKAIPVLQPLSEGQKSLVSAYDNIAIAYLEQKQADSALYYTQLSNTLNLKVQHTYEQSYIYYQFARTYTLLGESELAESYFKKSISYSTSHVNPEALSTAAAHFCRLLLSQNRIIEAKQYGTIGINAALASGMKRQVIDNADVLRMLYHQQKQTDSAYHYSMMVNAYRDSVFNEQKNLQVQNVVFSQQLHEKEVAQEKEKDETERKHNLQYATIALGLVSFVILFFLFSHSVVANQKLIKFLGTLSLLIVFEFLNLLLHPYLGMFTHHQPVFMLAIMVCVAALLIPLHHKLEHWVTHKLVEKNNKIRLAAAKKTIAKLEGNVNEAPEEKKTNAQQQL